MALKLNPLLLNRDVVKARRLPVFQHQASTSRGSHIEKTPTPWGIGYESLALFRRPPERVREA